MADFDAFIPSLHKPVSLLPISRHREALLYTIEQHPVTVLVGQTGSGKTTQLPQYLEAAGWCAHGQLVAVTQVRFLLYPIHFSMIDRHLQNPRSLVGLRRRRWHDE